MCSSKKKPGPDTGKLAVCAICTALGMILSYVEALIPFPFPVPGMKLGLANLAILLALCLYGTGAAILVSFMRILLTAMLFGTLMSLAFSLAGGMLSLLLMAVLKKTDLLPVMGISMAGGVMHNLGQVIVAAIAVGSAKMGYYFAVLMVTGAVTGLLIGLMGTLALKILKKVPDRR